MRIRVALIAALFALAVGPALALAVDPAQPAFGGPISGAQEVPPVATAATGEGTAVISPDGSTITYIVTYSGLSGPAVAAHIHIGAAGADGPVILPLTVGPSPMVGTLTAANLTPAGGITTFAQAVAAIKAGNTYFNIHTAANPGGEVRGQIVAKGNAEFVSLAGFQEVPPVTTSGTGNGWVLVSTDLSTLTYYVAYSGLSGPAVAAHIHTGATGVNGGIILPLAVSASPMVGTLTAANFTPSGSITTFAEAVAAIQAGNTYVNIHTAAHPAGEIRGQLGVTVAAPAPSPSPSLSPSPSPTAASSLPPTSTSPAGPTSGDPVVPAAMTLVAVATFAFAATRIVDRRRAR